MIKCPNCSAELKFDVKDQEITCEYCGSKFNPKELRAKAKAAEEDKKEKVEAKSYRCSECGAELLTFDETAVTFCSYCGSQAMIESKMIKINKPDYVIPFTKTKEECIGNYKKRLRKAFFAPSYMKSDIVISKFRSIYIPYGIYKLEYHGNCSNNGSKYNHRKGDYIYYDDYSIVADVDSEYEGISFDLNSKFYDKYSHFIPFDFKKVEPFDLNYLISFYADTKDVDEEVYDEHVKSIVREDANRKLRKEKAYSKYGCHNPKLPIRVGERKVGMFPLYFLAIRDKDNKHINYAVVNGETGKVAASLPLDFKKYLLVTALLAVLVYLLIDFSNILMLPRTIVILSIIAAVISMIVSNVQLNKLFISREHLDDFGYIFKNHEEHKNIIVNEFDHAGDRNFGKPAIIIGLVLFNSIIFASMNPPESYFLSMVFSGVLIVPTLIIWLVYKLYKSISTKEKVEVEVVSKERKSNFKEKFTEHLYKQFIAIIIGIAVLILQPVHDAYYYGAALITFLIVIISFYDLVKEHNELVSNKLPQLEKRGGDEDE